MTPKELKQLAKACREAGIKHYKNADVEFTLSDDVPVSNYRRRTAPELSMPEALAGETLSETDLLFWSTGAASEEEAEQ